MALYCGRQERFEPRGPGTRRTALNALRDQVTAELRNEKLGGDPGAFLALGHHDLATASERSGAKLGRVLPMLLVVLLISGGAFAVDGVCRRARVGHPRSPARATDRTPRAGPRQVQRRGRTPAPPWPPTSARLCSAALGLGGTDLGALDTGRARRRLPPSPGALLLCALLCLALGRAAPSAEGQYLLFPLTLLAAVPSAVVLQPPAERRPAQHGALHRRGPVPAGHAARRSPALY
ncbi:MAG: hypothetical protein R3F17_16060 [Planctomycetota bacterium]